MGIFNKKWWDKKVGDPVKKGFDKAGKDTKKAVGKAGKEIDQLDDKIVDAMESCVDSLTTEALQAGLKKTKQAVSKWRRECWRLEKEKPELVSAFDQVGFSLKIGPVKLAYSNFYSRAEKIDHQIDKFVHKDFHMGRKNILNLIRALAPDSIDLGVDVQLAALVVSSNSLAIGFEMDAVPTELALQILDPILKEMGVPA